MMPSINTLLQDSDENQKSNEEWFGIKFCIITRALSLTMQTSCSSESKLDKGKEFPSSSVRLRNCAL
jgi:hypothetical protein